MKLHHLHHTVAWGCLAASSGAMAEAPAPLQVPARISHYAATFVVNSDGSGTESREWALKVLQPEVVAGASKTALSYVPGVQKIEVIEAYTRKPDGRRVEVPKTSLDDAPEPTSNRHVVTVSFPDVAVGDSVVIAYRLVNSQPIFPAQFSVHESFPKSQAYDDVSIKVDTPAGLWTQYQARDLRQVRSLEKEGRKVTEWAWDNRQPAPGLPASHLGHEYQQDAGLAFSTFRSYGDLAKAYGQQAHAKAVVTAKVQQLADQITRDSHVTAPRDVARALYDWVLANIENAGTCLDLGAMVPRDVDVVIESRQGDCKDHATVLQALLRAKGIASTQALINAGEHYGLSKVPLVSMVNHVINHIPSLNLFADASSETTPFGMLPFADQGKPVLLVTGYKDGAKTPVTPVGANRQLMKTDVVIQPDGSATGTVQVALNGQFAVNARLRLHKLSKEQDENLVKGFFESGGLVGGGTLVKEEAQAWRDSYGYRTQFSVKSWLKRPGAGTFTIAPLFYSESPVADYLAAATQPVSDVETACASGHSEEAYRYQFPPGMDIISVPKNVKLDSKTLSYSATYQRQGQVLTVKRVFDDRTVGNLCTPAMAQAYKQFAAKAVPDATALVVFK